MTVQSDLMVTQLLLAVVTVLFFTYPAIAGLTGPVVSVIDGNTIEVLHNTQPERVRCSGIDCTEKDQAFGNRATQAASALVLGRDVMLQTHGQDKYGHTLADVLLPDSTILNHELVKDGWCWWYRKYAPGNAELEQLESEARVEKRGLWADKHPCRRGSGGSGTGQRTRTANAISAVNDIFWSQFRSQF
jgi:endonuclease YncB( thermonuclease family)